MLAHKFKTPRRPLKSCPNSKDSHQACSKSTKICPTLKIVNLLIVLLNRSNKIGGSEAHQIKGIWAKMNYIFLKRRNSLKEKLWLYFPFDSVATKQRVTCVCVCVCKQHKREKKIFNWKRQKKNEEVLKGGENWGIKIRKMQNLQELDENVFRGGKGLELGSQLLQLQVRLLSHNSLLD